MDGDEPFQSDCDSHEDWSCDRNLSKEGKKTLFLKSLAQIDYDKHTRG